MKRYHADFVLVPVEGDAECAAAEPHGLLEAHAGKAGHPGGPHRRRLCKLQPEARDLPLESLSPVMLRPVPDKKSASRQNDHQGGEVFSSVIG